MTLTAALPWLFAVIGLVLYFVATKTELKEAGRLAYACGILVGLLQAPVTRTILRLP